MYTIKYINGHVEVYWCGRFIFSADTKEEAIREMEEEYESIS